jgi:acyl-coenzyme A thioesterase PaaI-like protein
MKIPFIEDMGMQKREDGFLSLPFNPKLLNHIGTVHASAQFSLAETQTGFYLESMFPEYRDKIIPLLRSSTVKYKHPATKDIYAIATVSQELLEKFEKSFVKKGRAIISVNVEIRDSDEVVTMVGEFVWFVQMV